APAVCSPRSLRDALPICFRGADLGGGGQRSGNDSYGNFSLSFSYHWPYPEAVFITHPEDQADIVLIHDFSLLPCHDLFFCEVFRSEEHTSELQSRENLVC